MTTTVRGDENAEWDVSEGEFLRRREAAFFAPDPLAAHFPAGTGGAGGGRRGSIDRDLDRLRAHRERAARDWRRIKYGPYRTFAALRSAAKAAGYAGPLDTRSDMTRRLMLHHLCGLRQSKAAR